MKDLVVLLIVLLGCAAFTVGVLGPLGLLPKIKKPGTGKWESHPCKLPTNLDLPQEGRVWQCHCGRRWKYLRKKKDTDYPYSRTLTIWEERTPEMDMKDEMEKLEKLTRKAKESGL